MKILLFANSNWNLYNFRINLIKKINNRKNKIYFLGQNDKFTKKLLNLNINHLNLRLSPKGKNPIREIITLINLFYIIKKNNPDYILSFTIKPNLYSLLISFFIKTKVIVNITGLGNIFINKNFFTNLIIFFYKILLKNSYYIFFQNEDDLKYFKKLKLLNKSRYGILPGSGINLNLFQNNKKESFNNNLKFIYVGRTIKQKGVYEYCEASKILIKKFKNISFSMIGFGEFGHLKKKYPHINYIYSNNIDKLEFLNFDCLVLPSYREGMPRVVLEFSLLGIPSIVTNVPGCRHIIKDKFNGFLCDPYSIDSLIDAIEEYINLPLNKKIKMSHNAKKHVEENFNEKIVIKEYLNTLNEKR